MTFGIDGNPGPSLNPPEGPETIECTRCGGTFEAGTMVVQAECCDRCVWCPGCVEKEIEEHADDV